MRRRRGIALLAGLAALLVVLYLATRPPAPELSEPDDRGPAGEDATTGEARAERPEEAAEEATETPSSEATTPRAVLRGLVVDADGRPLAGARVSVLDRSRYGTSRGFGGPRVSRDQLLLALELLEEGRPLPGASVTTGDDGAFVFPALPPATYQVTARHPGLLAERVTATLREREDETIRIALGPGASIRARVIDASGNAVPDARLLCTEMSGAGRLPYGPLEETVSGADGGFLLDGLKPDVPHVVIARTPDGRLGCLIGVRPPEDDRGLVVRKAMTLKGTVRDDLTDAPIAGAELFGLLGKGVSDESGSYELPGILASPLIAIVLVEAEGYQPLSEMVGLTEHLVPGEALVRDFRLQPRRKGSVRLTVRDIEGSPLADVTIEARARREGEVVARAVTAEDGEARVEGLVTGHYRFQALKPGYVRIAPERGSSGEIRSGGATDLAVSSEKENEGTIVLAPAAPLTGRVRDPAGRPLGGVEVAFGNVRCTSGESGEFELPAFPRDGAAGLFLRKDGYLMEHEIVDPGSAPVEIELRPAARIDGRVVDADGRALAGVDVEVRVGVNRDFGDWSRSEADGSFRVRHLRPETYVLTFKKEGFGSRTLAPIDLATGERRQLEVRLADGHEVEVVAVDASGAAVDATVHVFGPLESPEDERTLHSMRHSRERRRGRVTFHAAKATFSLVPGRYRILVVPFEDQRVGAVELERAVGDAGTVRVTLSGEPSRIVLAPTLAAGHDILGVRAKRVSPAPSFGFSFAPDEGHHRSQPLPPGRYELLIWVSLGQGSRVASRTLENVEPGGEPIPVDLTGVR